jgi:predicted nucleic acid-binding protein
VKCLDTDLLVAILRGKEEARDPVGALDEIGREATTSVNAFEIVYGAQRSARRSENLTEALRLLGRLHVIPFDFPSAQRAGEIAAKLAAVGEGIDYRDSMIAGIALENGITLVTRNEKHFSRIKGLKLEAW